MKSKESRADIIRALILEMLSDGKIHTTKEIMNIAVEREIIPDKNTDIVYNILFHMKKKGIITTGPDKAQYCLVNKQETNGEVEKPIMSNKSTKISTLNLDADKYSLLEPMPNKYSKMQLVVKENGELKLNSALMKKINECNIEIFVSKDLRTIILNPLGMRAHKFTKAGTAKNREMVMMLKKLRIKFPIIYTVEWNEDVGAWEGVLDISNKI